MEVSRIGPYHLGQMVGGKEKGTSFGADEWEKERGTSFGADERGK